ncbi:MAG: hypothetical protein AB1Z98_15580 [Nannocystaceae bacterium]
MTATMSGSDGDSTAADDATAGTGNAACAVAPEDWAAPDWDLNAAEALALRAQLDTLTGDATMRGAETGAVMIEDLAQLLAAWEDGDPSLAAVANPGYVPVIEASFDEFLEILAAGEQSLVDMNGAWAPGPAGGIWADDDRGINEGGLEVRQLVDKGGYSGGILYAYALGLTEGEIDAATVEAIAAAWGANAQLDPDGELTDAAGYALQMGFHAEMAGALATAQVLSGNAECVAERDEALVTFFSRWEQSMYARLVFYVARAEGKLLAATTETELASVLHDVAEGVGVAAAFIGLPDPDSGPLSGAGRLITDAEVLEIMGAMGVNLDDLGASTSGSFVESLPALEDARAQIESTVMTVYGLDAATVMAYAMPTPG